MSRPGLYGDLSAWALIAGDSLKLLAQLPPACVDAVVTDPPYGIGFGGEAWDSGELTNAEAFQRWTSEWAAGALRALKPGGWLAAFGTPRTFHRLVAGVEDAGFEVRDQLLWLYAQGVPKSRRRADGLAGCLKPAYEPVLLARKPLIGSLDINLAEYGTGALNIDATRVPRAGSDRGYWPANIAASHDPACAHGSCTSACPVGLMDAVRPISRLFYEPKASRAEREAGCEALPLSKVPIYPRSGGDSVRLVRNTHPTVKPLELMRWLTRLLCPPSGTVLDPFAGSASTGCAALLEGRQFVGIERDERYVAIAQARLAYWKREAGP